MSDRPYIDRNGNRHTATVFESWSARMIEIMSVLLCTEDLLKAPRGKAEAVTGNVDGQP